jgi:membrane-associated protein
MREKRYLARRNARAAQGFRAGRNQNMNRPARRWKKLAVCILLVCAIAGLGGHALAQEPTPPATPEVAAQPDFWVQLVQNLFNSRALMQTLGQPQYTAAAFLALNLIVFVETGLLVGFFLPGDSLLVTAGLIASNPDCGWNLPLLLVTLCIAAVTGDTIGYWIGYKTGPAIFSREQSFFFHKDHLLKAKEFYEKHGGKTIVLARFMPILRTFAPVVAGVGRMEYRQFLFFNVFGGVGWVTSMVLVGYFLPAAVNPLLQRLFGPAFHVEEHVEKVVILVVLASISPAVFAWLRSRMMRKPEPKPELVEISLHGR